MKIQLVSLELINFKGCKSRKIAFDPRETNIFGMNTAGKTTIVDAYSYLQFGKDSQDNKTFAVQTLDENGNRIDHLETEVTGKFIADGRSIEFKRRLIQNWPKKKGSELPEFDGYREELFINDVPCKLSEYKQKVDTLIQESIFKLITNVGYFNSLNWKERRQFLMDMADVKDEDIARGNKSFESLIYKLTEQGKSLEEYKKEVAAKKRKLVEQLRTIQPRIDEADRAKPAPKDWEKIEADIKTKSAKIQELEKAIGDQVKIQTESNKKILDHNRLVLESKQHLQTIEFQIRSEYNKPSDKESELADAKFKLQDLATRKNDMESRIESFESLLTDLKKDIETKQAKIESLKAEKDQLTADWKAENKRKFEVDDSLCQCPTCQREFTPEVMEEKKDEWQANFNTEKKANLNKIVDKANDVNSEIDKLESEIEKTNTRIQNGQQQIATCNESLESLNTQIAEHNQALEALESGKVEKEPFESVRDTNKEYKAQLAVISKLEAETPDKNNSIESIIDEKRTEKGILSNEVNQLQISLKDKETIKQQEDRIAELQSDEKTWAQELANFEKEEFTMLEFTKAKVAGIEKAINSKFQIVRFKMFKQLVNGGEEECCEITVNGVPYQDVNQAGKVNASLDVINALCDHYGVYAPIMLDGRESVSEIIPVKSQIVNLVVSPSDKALRVA